MRVAFMETFYVETENVRGKSRPRFANGRAYQPKSDAEWESEIADAYRSQCAEHKEFEGPVSIILRIYRKMPSSRPRRIESEPDIYTPDIDNLQNHCSTHW